MHRFRLIYTAVLLAVLAAPGLALEQRLGPVSMTEDQMLTLHFLSLHPSASRPHPVRVQVQFFNAAGELIAVGGGGDGAGDILPMPGGWIPVESEKIASVHLDGSTLTFPENVTSLTVQPVITIDQLGSLASLAWPLR